jgi:hypothetical protein
MLKLNFQATALIKKERFWLFRVQGIAPEGILKHEMKCLNFWKEHLIHLTKHNRFVVFYTVVFPKAIPKRERDKVVTNKNTETIALIMC